METKEWIKVIVLIIVMGLVKAGGHFMRLFLLAVLGLAGLWMMHKLAEDYNKIRKPITRALLALRGKRAADLPQIETTTTEQLLLNKQIQGISTNLEKILKNDPKDCIKSYICQLSTKNVKHLIPVEANILKLVRMSLNTTTSEVQNILNTALKIGDTCQHKIICCRRKYKHCTFSTKIMTKILKYFDAS